MHTVVKITAYDPHDSDLDEVDYENTVWHAVSANHGDMQILCSGLFFGSGASGISYQLKERKRGGITCYECLRLIKAYKAVKL